MFNISEYRALRVILSRKVHIIGAELNSFVPLQSEPADFIKETDVYCFQAENNKSGRFTSQLSSQKAILSASSSSEKITKSSLERWMISGWRAWHLISSS